MWIGGVALHLFTILFTYKFSGFGSAFLALILPLIAQIYWFIKMWVVTGSFINDFSFNILVFIGWLSSAFIFAFLGTWIEPKEAIETDNDVDVDVSENIYEVNKLQYISDEDLLLAIKDRINENK